MTACMVNDSDLGLQQLAMGTTEGEWAEGVYDEEAGETPDETLARWVRQGNPAAEELRRNLEGLRGWATVVVDCWSEGNATVEERMTGIGRAAGGGRRRQQQ